MYSKYREFYLDEVQKFETKNPNYSCARLIVRLNSNFLSIAR